jgi:DNA-binding NarL/FixJ family response regulator
LTIGASLGRIRPKGIIVLSSERASLKDDMSETRKVRVILVEDHIAFRQALAFLLGREPDLKVVAQAGSLAQAREVLVDGHIDVAVVDLALPDGDGRELFGELRRRHSGISVVVLTATIGPGHHEEVLKAGADAVLHKVASIPTIVEEVRRLVGRLRESGPGGPRLGQEGGQQQKDARREQDPF